MTVDTLSALQAPRLFFVHLQKTAGITVYHHISRNVPPEQIYPEITSVPSMHFQDIGLLRAMPPEQLAALRVVAGHFPYFVKDIVGAPLVTATVLRHPVERTLSLLKMMATSAEFAGKSLSEIYDSPLHFKLLIEDHQTRMFAMRESDQVDTFMHYIPMDEDRLEQAKINLRQVDILGLQEHLDAFILALEQRFGWPRAEVRSMNVRSGTWEIDAGLRARIETDCAFDMKFYAFAQALHAERQLSAG